MTAADDRLQRATDAIVTHERREGLGWTSLLAAAVLDAFADDFDDLDRLREIDQVLYGNLAENTRLQAENAALRTAGDTLAERIRNFDSEAFFAWQAATK